MKLIFKKRAGALTLCIALLLSVLFPPAAAAEDNVYKTFTPEGSFTIDAATGYVTGYVGAEETVILPAVIQGVPVNGISTAFTDNKTLKTLMIPDTVQVFGDGAFSGCSALSTIAAYSRISDETLAAEAADLAANPWKTIDKTKRIEAANADGTFTYYYITMCSGRVLLPTALTYVGAMAFRGTTAVSGFIVPAGNTAFKTSADTTVDINDISGNPVTYNMGALLLSADGTVMYRWASAYHYAGEYALPEGIVIIPDCAAEHANDVQGFKIPSTVTTIGAYAFCQGNNINTITFAENAQVTTIGAWAFANNSNLHSALPASVTTLGEYCFASCVNMELSIENSSLTAIPDYCFYECNNYHFTTFPPTLTSIGKYAFYDCDNINNVYFTDQITSIGEGAFKDCGNLHEIEVPEGLTTLEAETFAGCQNLNKIVLPDSLKEIESGAFSGCNNVHELVIPKGVEYIAPDSFEGVNPENIDVSQNEYAQQNLPGALEKEGATFTVGKIKYKVTKSSKKSATVQVIGASSKKATSVKIPASVTYRTYKYKVTSIKASAFSGYKKLKTVTIGNEVATIGKNAFKGCTKLTTVTLGSKVKSIGANAFSGDKKLKTLKIKSKVLKTVGKNAFKGINGKAKITVPKSKLSKYKKLLKGKGQPKGVTIKK